MIRGEDYKGEDINAVENGGSWKLIESGQWRDETTTMIGWGEC